MKDFPFVKSINLEVYGNLEAALYAMGDNCNMLERLELTIYKQATIGDLKIEKPDSLEFIKKHLSLHSNSKFTIIH